MHAGTAVRVGLIDSGLGHDWAGAVVASRRFAPEGGGPARSDRIAHGSLLARALLEQFPSAALCVAQVFEDAARTDLDRVLSAIDWLAARDVRIIHMSLGVRVPDARLREACAAAAGEGIVLVASIGARGPLAYPAAYPECIAVCGDARCASDEVSCLGGGRADFGAHPWAVSGSPEAGGGASFAAARVSGRLARLLAEGVPAAGVRAALAARCAHFERERRAG